MLSKQVHALCAHCSGTESIMKNRSQRSYAMANVFLKLSLVHLVESSRVPKMYLGPYNGSCGGGQTL